MYRVTLTFVVDAEESDAWDIADRLEQAAIRQNYREANGFVTALDRDKVLGTEEAPIRSSAETAERRTAEPTAFGTTDGEMITLGGEHGESG